MTSARPAGGVYSASARLPGSLIVIPMSVIIRSPVRRAASGIVEPFHGLFPYTDRIGWTFLQEASVLVAPRLPQVVSTAAGALAVAL